LNKYKQKKVLIVTNGMRKTFGYCTVTSNIYKLIKEKFDIAFFYLAGDEKPLENVTTYTAKSFKELGETFASAVREFTPDVVITIGDIWNFNFICEVKKTLAFNWLAYIAVEGEHFPKKIKLNNNQVLNIDEIMNYIDTIITYSEFGKTELEKSGYDVHDFIYHGVDTSIFKPYKLNQKELKKHYFDFDENPFMFLCVADNQPRKRFDVLLRAWKIYQDEFATPLTPAFLTLITQAVKFGGINIPEICERYNITETVRVHTNYVHGSGIYQNELVTLYNLADFFVLASSAEGFGLPYIESLACGTPIIYTQYATPKEIIDIDNGAVKSQDYVALPLKPETFMPIWDLSYNFAELDPRKLAKLLKFAYDEKKRGAIKSENCVNFVKRYEWKNFKNAWVNAINASCKKSAKTGALI